MRRVIALLCGSLLAALLLALAGTQPASAAIGPRWDINALTDTTVAPGADFEYIVELRNSGDETFDESSQETTFTAALPAGLTAVEADIIPKASKSDEMEIPCTAGDGSSPVLGASAIRCLDSFPLPPSIGTESDPFEQVRIKVQADLSLLPGHVLTATFTIAAGGAPSATTASAIRVSISPPGFGPSGFEALPLGRSGSPYFRAGGHPGDFVVSLGLNTYEDRERPRFATATPIAPFKDAYTELPPGFVANSTGFEVCTVSQLANAFSQATESLCPTDSQLGTARVLVSDGKGKQVFFGPVAVYNMDPPPGSPARLGFDIGGSLVVLDAFVRGDHGYTVEVASRDASEALPIVGAKLDLWGEPSASLRDSERACPGKYPPYAGGPVCLSTATAELPYFRNPTSCTGPVPTTIHVDSWFEPGSYAADGAPDLSDSAWHSATSLSHQSPGYPYPPEEWGAPAGFGECEAEPFSPSLQAAPPSGAQAGEPTTLSFDLHMPQQGLEEPESISESDLRRAVVTLPAGVRLNPSSADGLGACTPEQVGLTTPVGQSDARFKTEDAHCPESSKIGSLSISTPLLDHEITGGVYLAQLQQNPFGTLAALYLIAKDPVSGVDLVLPGKVDLDPSTGQITTTFDNSPQLPFETLHLELKSGPRAPLVAPRACGTYSTHSTFTGWSGKVVEGESSFTINQGCPNSGFSPKLTAGTQNPLAGTTSPFNLRLTREDGEAELFGLTDTFPPGLTGYLKGIAYCPDSVLASISEELGTGAAQEASPSCPAASQIGVVTAGAGAGPNPFYVQSGKAYLAGPYKGAPLSLAAVVPAVAGPFDLGTSVVRTALRVDPETAQITAVSDTFPTILHGIPLDLRDVRISLNRPNFTLNPTDCEPMSITSTITGTGGASASPSVHFQVGGCEHLGFKPELALTLKGGTKRTQFPALGATLKMPAGGANIARAAVTLPPTEQIENAHINLPCTRVQFAAEACPPSSVLGYAKAYSPLLDQPLEGPVYFRANGGTHPLPDIVADLKGQIHVVLVGHVDAITKHGVTRIRNTFETVPDAPVSKFTLNLYGGKRGYLVNNSDLCKSTNRALVQFDAQNGKFSDSSVKVANDCKALKKGGGGKKRARR